MKGTDASWGEEPAKRRRRGEELGTGARGEERPGTGAPETASLNLASFELGGFAPRPRAGGGQTKRLALVSTTASASLLMSVVYFVGGGL